MIKIMKFIQPKAISGFTPLHVYEVKIEDDVHNKSGYVLTSKFDYTDNEDIDAYIRLSSEGSIDRYFKECSVDVIN